MSTQIQQVRKILIDLKRQINERKKIWEELTKASSEEDANFHKQWCDHEAMCWIHASTSPEKLIERSNYFPNRKRFEHAQASLIASAWEKEIRKRRRSYDEFDSHHLPESQEDESLKEFVLRLEHLYTNGQVSTKRAKQALNSFLHYLRQNYPDEDTAFVEEIFPVKKRVVDGVITRITFPIQRPLSRQVASSIIASLVDKIIEGRPNATRNRMEVLAIIWICLATGSLRQPTRVDDLYQIPISSLFSSKKPNVLSLPTLFGMQEVEVSPCSKDYLKALATITQQEGLNSLPTKEPQTLRRTLNKVLDDCGLEDLQKEISFQSFILPPHNAGRCRR